MRKYTLLLAFLLLIGFRQDAKAQFQAGPRVGYEIDEFQDPFIGVEARLALGSLPILLNPVFDYYLDDEDEISFAIKGNLIYEFGVDNQSFTPYAGPGIAIGIGDEEDEEDGSADVGLNILGGARLMTGPLQPFVQAEIGLGNQIPFTIGGGLLFTFGGN